MCDNCTEFQELLFTVERKFDAALQASGTADRSDSELQPLLTASEVNTSLQFLNVWHQKQCMCVFREVKNLERFSLVVQCITKIALIKLKELPDILGSLSSTSEAEPAADSKEAPASGDQDQEPRWSVEDLEKLLTYMARVFMLQFPLYLAAKQAGSRLDDLSQAEATSLAVFLDVTGDVADIPLVLLRNVARFCRSGGLNAMTAAFKLSASVLPSSLAHGLVSVLCNLKLWLNPRAISQLFGPVRSAALQYMSGLGDQELRHQPTRAMADFLWSSVKDNFESPLSLDKDGLELAFKYFSSTTLTMRLTGISQVNTNISLFNEMCNTESVVEVETVGLQLAQWILDSKLVEHIFGPNLHVEVIKQSHIILNFLAMEGKITNSQLDSIWQSAQLKHCSKQVHDILPPLIKNLEAGPVLHLYDLVKKLPVKDHTEQSIYLAQVLQKFIWTSGGTFSHLLQDVDSVEGGSAAVKPPIMETPGKKRKKKSEGNSSDEDDDVSDDVLAELAEMDDDNDDIEEFSDVDDDDDDEDDDIASSDSDCDLRKSVEETTKSKQLKSSPDSAGSSKKTKMQAMGKRRKDTGVKRALESKISETEPEIELAVGGGVKKQKVENEMKVAPMNIMPTPVDAVAGKPRVAFRGPPGPNLWGRGPGWSRDSGQGAVMTELANLVGATGGPHDMFPGHFRFRPEPGPVFRSSDLFEAQSEDGEAHSPSPASSHASGKSDKNLGDFADEESTDEEMVRLAQAEQLGSMLHQHQHLATMAQFYQSRMAGAGPGGQTRRHGGASSKIMSRFTMDKVAEPGNTLLWDLIQDGSIEMLAEGLALEAEKALTNLLCYNMDRFIRVKFIEGCLSNLQNNKSVVVSLRLLPKLFQSFHNFPGSDTHEMILYTEKTHEMTKLFFENLQRYSSERKAEGVKTDSFYSHTAHIQARLQFLAMIFSNQLSAECFRLNQSQVSILWECLANDALASDDLFQWLLIQAHSKDQHALGIDSVRFIHREKLPALSPETMTMTGLNLLSQLTTLVQMADGYSEASGAGESPESRSSGFNMTQMWSIALRAASTDVSMKAIHLLNSAYLGRGEEFLITCMEHLTRVTRVQAEDTCTADNLVTCHRALLLLKSHLETFRKKYAFQFRRLAIEGNPVSSHAELVEVRHSSLIRINVQPGGAISEKVTIDMHTSDLVADLRAEICVWWEGKMGGAGLEPGGVSMLGSLLGSSVMGPHTAQTHLRLISQGQEITPDLDERSLAELGFKDFQTVFCASLGSAPSRVANFGEFRGELPPFPGRDKIPMLLLLQPRHFSQLFSLMASLSEITTKNESGLEVPDTKAQIMSRRVWEILLLLPTSPEIKQRLEDVDSESDMASLLDPHCPQKLLYTFYIIDWLGRPARLRRQSGLVSDSLRPADSPSWVTRFKQAGGLKQLASIFESGALGRRGEAVWCEWKQDCLGALLRLLVQFGVDTTESDVLADQLVEGGSSGGQSGRRRGKFERHSQGARTKSHLMVPILSGAMLELMECPSVMVTLGHVFLDSKDGSSYRTGMFGRGQIVHFAMSLLVSWVYSDTSGQVEDMMLSQSEISVWLKQLLLEDPDPAVRREMCTGVYRLCLGTASQGRTGAGMIAPLLAILLQYFDHAQTMKPPRRESVNHPVLETEPGKEPFGPACRDYFWVLCKLVENLKLSEDNMDLVDIETLALRLCHGITNRPWHERRQGGNTATADDALIGMLNLMSAVLQHNPEFKQLSIGQELVDTLFMFLFALPTPTDKLFPKCKSQLSRSACYDLLVEMVRGSLANYAVLHRRLVLQHAAPAHKPYPWEYWPREEQRSECGYVGLVNLGATCYMATAVQQLFMLPAIRECVLQYDGMSLSNTESGFGKHHSTLYELRRMFAHLLESERKAYNPLSFCKTYTMDQQPLNTGEQKDMAEFFIDLLSKTEEMTPELKNVVKKTFCGTLSNNVVSLDCGHVSTTTEEFYTVRCQVAEMRSLYQSLEEVCVKDMLEGDNMYTCSQCSAKVRAEKRACFKSLPDILAFNTMRYSFNMVTMMKEKVNTHFSFPFRLDMTPYMEQTLIPNKGKETTESLESSLEYELIGVTVHTGTADGGHYYAFIRDRTSVKDKWYSFNDAEVKTFDPSQIASECFGGEMSSRTYDQVTDKFLDLSIEKTNSAYMLFYERVKRVSSDPGPSTETATETSGSEEAGPSVGVAQSGPVQGVSLSQDLEDWIWQDNRNFIQDNNIFDHTYFNFMWQMVQYLPTTLNKDSDGAADDITIMSAKLATSFFLETFIHAKEKLNIVQWVEVLTKQLDSSVPACRWFLDTMASDNHWPVTIFLKCNIGTIRQMFHRLVIHVIQKLRSNDCEQYILPWQPGDKDNFPDTNTMAKIGSRSPITRFVRMLLTMLDQGYAKPHLKHLSELFSFLLDFARMGDQEAEFLLQIQAITTCVEFYLKICGNTNASDTELEVSDDDDSDDDIIALPMAGTDMAAARTASLDKMVFLLAVLVEKSRGDDNIIHLSRADMNSLTTGKTLLFLYNITRDNINIRQTCNLIFSLTRHNPSLAQQVAEMVFLGVKNADHSLNFFRLLTLLTELSGGPAGLPCFTTLIMYKVWDLAKSCPQAALDWLSIQVTRNRYAQSGLLGSLPEWVEMYLIAHNNIKVRTSAAFLLVSLVPTPHFRQTFRNPRQPPSHLRESIEASDGLETVSKILEFLLSLLRNCKPYIDISLHGTNKLVSYFQVMTHLLLSKNEKRLLGPHFPDLWQLFHPKLSEPSIPVHQNKQALLQFWYNACLDCPENIQLILSNPHVVKNIAFNYILADHEDSDVVNFNRSMLPTYYGLLRQCCASDKKFCRTLANHQNIQWAFKNIAPFSTQYPGAVDELMKLTQLFVSQSEESSEEEVAEIRQFRTTTLQLYLSILDGRSSWATLISCLKILVLSTEDKLFTVCNNGLSLIYDAFNILHLMHHEATACHVTQELREILGIFSDLVRTVRSQSRSQELRTILSRWKDMTDMTSRLLTLCNSYSCPELREICLASVKEMLMFWPQEMLTILVPMFHRAHVSAADSDNTLMGPFFPRRERRGGLSASASNSSKSSRPPRPMLQLAVPANQLEASHGEEPEYDRSLHHYYWTYHNLVDLMVRLAVNENTIVKMLIDLSAMVGLDGVPLHFQLFPKLWLDIYSSRNIEATTLTSAITLLVDSHGFLEYVDAVLLDERSSLNNQYVFQFLYVFFPKVSDQVLTDQVKSLIQSLCTNLHNVASSYDLNTHGSVRRLNGDLRALILVQSGVREIDKDQLRQSVITLKERTQTRQVQVSAEIKEKTGSKPESAEEKEGGKSAEENIAGTVAETRKSVDEKPTASSTDAKEVGGSSSSKRLSPTEKLRDALVCFEKSLDMLLTDLSKEVAKTEETRNSEDTESKKEEGDACMAGPSKT